MGEIAEDCFNYAMDELEKYEHDPDWQEEQQALSMQLLDDRLNDKNSLEYCIADCQKCRHFGCGNR